MAVRAELEDVTGMEHLKGRKVGVLSHGSCDSFLLRHMLEKAGGSIDDVYVVPLGPRYGDIGVLKEGLVDATFLVEPSLSLALRQGTARIIGKAADAFPRYQWNTLFCSEALMKRSPHVVDMFMKANSP